MKWFFVENFDIETDLSREEIINRIKSVSRPKHNIVDTLNPDHVFKDGYKKYVGTINDSDFRLKRRYYTVGARGTATTMGLIIRGQITGNLSKQVLHLKFTAPSSNILWLLFPPLWMAIGFGVGMDDAYFHHIPVITLVVLLLLVYLYRLVLSRFRYKAKNVRDEFDLLLNGANRGGATFQTWFTKG